MKKNWKSGADHFTKTFCTLVLGCAVWLVGPAQALGGTLGEVVLDFNGGGFTMRDLETPDFTKTKTYDVNAFDVTKFGLAADKADAVKDAVLDDLLTLYSGFDISFSYGGVPESDHVTLFVGEDKTNPGHDTGISDSIDWRNLDKNGKAVIYTTSMRGDSTFPAGPPTVANVALAIANVAGHELGHTLGLSHTDIIGGAGQADLRMMNKADRLDTPNNIDRYSKFKLGVAQNGIANFDTGGNDAGDTFAQATDLTLQLPINGALNVSSVLFDDTDKDFFKFTLSEPKTVTLEVFSGRFMSKSVPGHDASLTPDFIDPVLKLWQDAANEVDIAANGGQVVNDAEGTTGNRDLIFEVSLAKGTYAFSVEMGNAAYDDITGEGGAGGFYEVLVAVPEPSTLSLVTLGGLTLLLRYRRNSLARRPQS